MLKYIIRKNPKNPVLITVPHSGSFYPELFKNYIKLDLGKIRKIEDYHSDKILKLVKKENVDILIAKCSRAVVDLNRSRKSVDNDMFNGTVIINQPDEKKMIAHGLGVFPRFISNKSIFKTKLPLSYSKKMLEEYYDPFHKSLSNQLEFLLKKFGFCYHFDLHTMPSKALKHFKVKPDIVLGNNFGKSSSEKLISYTKNSFQKFGLKVEINNPYAGGFITRKYGNPLAGIETVQIEINRSLYMDEKNLKINNIHYLQEIFSEIFNNFGYSFRLAAE
ncbi:N-formylglutamate amidohydrolase [bacterium]|nr:N-formylglutamate amidohydrolase [bacterium]